MGIDGVIDASPQFEAEHCIILDSTKLRSAYCTCPATVCVCVCQRRLIMNNCKVLGLNHTNFSDLVHDEMFPEEHGPVGHNYLAMCDLNYEFQQVCGLCKECAAADPPAPTFTFGEGDCVASEWAPLVCLPLSFFIFILIFILILICSNCAVLCLG